MNKERKLKLHESFFTPENERQKKAIRFNIINGVSCLLSSLLNIDIGKNYIRRKAKAWEAKEIRRLKDDRTAD